MTIEITGDKKSYMLALLSLIIVVLLALWGWDHFSLKHELAEQIENSAGKDVIIKRWKDNANREHVLSEARQVNLKELRHSQDSSMKAIRDEIGSIKNFVSRVTVSSTTAGTLAAVARDTIIKQVVGKDTSEQKGKIVNYKDSWLSLKGTLVGNDFNASYELRNSYTTDTKWQRSKWWKKKELSLEIRSDNPNTTVNKVQSIIVSVPRTPWYGTRIFVGAVSFGAGYMLGTLR